jgi:hypothetical protein
LLHVLIKAVNSEPTFFASQIKSLNCQKQISKVLKIEY